MNAKAESQTAARSLRPLLTSALLLFALARPAAAAISHGPAPANKAEADRQMQLLNEQAVMSQQEKLRVAQERNAQRLDERAEILAGMNSELQARQQAVQIPSASVAPVSVTALSARWSKPMLGLCLVAFALMCGFLFKRKREQAETVPDWLTYPPDTAAGSATDKSVPTPLSAPLSATEKSP